MKRSIAAVIGLVLAALALVAGPASAATPYCGIRWGSLAKTAPEFSTDPLVNVRTGRHACYDRLVLDVAGDPAGYTVGYVPQLMQDGSGFVVPARGGARLQVTVQLPAYSDASVSTFTPADENELTNVAGYRTFRQVVWLGSFEGYSSVGLGVRARLPFRVFVLDGPGGGSRIVVDVAHRW
jgi:hypothetical protein